MPSTWTTTHTDAACVGREADGGAAADGAVRDGETTEMRGAAADADAGLQCGL